MFQRYGPARYSPFTESEFAALQALRIRYETQSHVFPDRELAYLRFLRWLVRQHGRHRAVKQPVPAEEKHTSAATEATADGSIGRLKAAYEAGYYRTETAEGHQVGFPWQYMTCKDCPFWSRGICSVLAEYRWSTAHTCRYFDPQNQPEAQRRIEERRWQWFRRSWDWFNGRGRAR